MNHTRRGLAAAVALACAFLACAPAKVPVWGTLPEFSLSDQSAQQFGSKELSGKVWIADFIFTSCPSQCPMLTRKMADVQHEIRQRDWDDVRLVSISVDPDHDTPKLLAQYADKYGADGAMWRFLTGTRPEIWKLSSDGFSLPVVESEREATGPILHSNKFVLADQDGRIRGYYDALDKDDMAKLVDDVGRVRAESGSS